MDAVLPMAEQLLQLARLRLDERKPSEALSILRKLLALQDLRPSVAAEANFVIAEIQLERNDLCSARRTLGDSLARQPDHASAHFLLAQCHEWDEQDGSEEQCLEHYQQACALAPDNPVMTSAYARKHAEIKDSDEGLDLLRTTYAEHSDIPEVVEDFVNSLIDHHRVDEAELVVVQAGYRNQGDRRFEHIRRRFEQRRRESRLFGGYSTQDTDPRDVIRFENFSASRKNPKPRSQKRPPLQPPESSTSYEAPTRKLASLSDQMDLGEVLKRMGGGYVAGLYDQLGLLGKRRVDLQRREIQAALLQRTFLNALAKTLPTASRRLLRTVVQAGGYVPASILFQNDGPDSPPPDHAQPLILNGLLYFGREQGNRSGSMMAVIPVDLHRRLAAVLKIDVGD